MDNLFVLLFLVSFVCLVVGLIKPTAFSRFIKGKITRKRIGKIFGIATIVFFVLFAITTDSPKNKNEITQQPVVENTQNTEIVEENKNENPASVAEETKTDVTSAPTKKETETVPVTTPTPTPTPTPTSTQVKQTDDQNIAPTPSETISQKNAVAKAKSYLGYSAFSHDGLVDQLEYEQFSHADAVYGTDNCGANWNEQVVKKAKSYMEYSAFSRGSLIDQLIYEKFTQAQAEYGADSIGL